LTLPLTPKFSSCPKVFDCNLSPKHTAGAKHFYQCPPLQTILTATSTPTGHQISTIKTSMSPPSCHCISPTDTLSQCTHNNLWLPPLLRPRGLRSDPLRCFPPGTYLPDLPLSNLVLHHRSHRARARSPRLHIPLPLCARRSIQVRILPLPKYHPSSILRQY
jgi:hypothetical protein